MYDLDRTIRQMKIIDNQWEIAIQHRFDTFVDQFTEKMAALMMNQNRNYNHDHGRNPNLMVVHDREYNDFPSDIEAEEFEEDMGEDADDVEEEEYDEDEVVDEDEDLFEDDSKPIFDVYTLEDEVVSEVEIEPIFDKFPLEEEFVSENEEIVIVDESIFDTYPPEEEFVFGDEDAVIDNEPIFDAYPLEENFVTGDVRNMDYQNKKILDEIYEHQIREAAVQEKVTQEDLIFTKDGVILIVPTDCSMQDEKVVDERSISMMIDGDSSIHNEVLTGPISAWWESTFCIGFIRKFDSRGINRKFEGEFCPPWRE